MSFRRPLFSRFPALLATIVVCATAPTRAAQDEGIHWLGDYREAIRQAKQTQKPIFVEFRCEA